MCGKCRKRRYCGRECQLRDWKEVSHKHWCGKSGEIGFDFEIQPCGEKGLGMVALRTFQKNDLIMIERPVLKVPWLAHDSVRIDHVESSAQAATLALAPEDGDFVAKFKINCMECREGESGLYITISRINHDCLGNASHTYLKNRGVQVLVARCTIKSGEEITITYSSIKMLHRERHDHLLQTYQISCRCRACKDPDFDEEVRKMNHLDKEITHSTCLGKIEYAIATGHELLKLYDKHDLSSWRYYDLYLDLFEAAICKQRYLESAKQYIEKAYKAALSFTHDDSHENVAAAKVLVDAPTSHSNYGRHDKTKECDSKTTLEENANDSVFQNILAGAEMMRTLRMLHDASLSKDT
jgi:SET domain/MYND finger